MRGDNWRRLTLPAGGAYVCARYPLRICARLGPREVQVYDLDAPAAGRAKTGIAGRAALAAPPQVGHHLPNVPGPARATSETRPSVAPPGRSGARRSLAVEVGFKPPEGLPPYTLSRRAPAATRRLHPT